MFLSGGAHPEGELVFSCHQSQKGRLLVNLSLAFLSLSLAWSVWVLCLSLMSTEPLGMGLSLV